MQNYRTTRCRVFQTIGALYYLGHEQEALVLAEESWLDKVVMNPKTNRKVKVRNLPPDQREKYKPHDASKEKEEPSQMNCYHFLYKRRYK